MTNCFSSFSPASGLDGLDGLAWTGPGFARVPCSRAPRLRGACGTAQTEHGLTLLSWAPASPADSLSASRDATMTLPQRLVHSDAVPGEGSEKHALRAQ